jgi:putative transposase
MMFSIVTDFYKRHRFPREIISHAVWLHFRFPLSHRDVEDLLFVRRVIVSYETIRKWCRKFGQQYTNYLRHRRPQLGDKWHLDEVFVTFSKERHYRWRVVDQNGNILDILVQRWRDKKAAKKLFRKLLKGCRYVLRVIVTDKLKSYSATKREIWPGVMHRYINNRAENSHQPTRQRERRMQGFKLPGYAQRFLSAYGPIAQHFQPRRHRLSAPAYRQDIRKRCYMWGEITGAVMAASRHVGLQLVRSRPVVPLRRSHPNKLSTPLEFQQHYKETWLIGRHGCKTPSQVRQEQLATFTQEAA